MLKRSVLQAPDAQVVLTHDDDWCALGKVAYFMNRR